MMRPFLTHVSTLILGRALWRGGGCMMKPARVAAAGHDDLRKVAMRSESGGNRHGRG